ncbi:hypothetical protein D9M72_619140 [compost metagenome]
MLKEAARDRCAGIVDQNTNALILAQALLDLGQILLVRQVGGHNVDIHAGFAPQPLGKLCHAHRIACDQNEIVTAARKSLRIDGADTGGSTGYEDCRLLAHRVCSFDLFMIVIMYLDI